MDHWVIFRPSQTPPGASAGSSGAAIPATELLFIRYQARAILTIGPTPGARHTCVPAIQTGLSHSVSHRAGRQSPALHVNVHALGHSATKTRRLEFIVQLTVLGGYGLTPTIKPIVAGAGVDCPSIPTGRPTKYGTSPYPFRGATSHGEQTATCCFFFTVTFFFSNNVDCKI